MSYEEKSAIIEEVSTIAEMINEAQNRLATLPRNQTAARQLGMIANRLEGWRRTFGPVEEQQPLPKNSPYSRADVDRALKAYRKYGYFGLSTDQKEVIKWFDEHYPQNAA